MKPKQSHSYCLQQLYHVITPLAHVNNITLHEVKRDTDLLSTPHVFAL